MMTYKILLILVLIAGINPSAFSANALPLLRQQCASTLHDYSPPTRRVVDLFLELSRIPRGSGREKQIRDFLVSIARRTGHTFEIDRTGNLTIEVPATGPFENTPGSIALQSHMDMVLSVPGSVHNRDLTKTFEKGVPNIVFEGDFVHTQGVSSLGADNGIGVATMLSYLFDKAIPHPKLKLLFTVEEETTFRGATAIKIPTDVKALINLDMEVIDQVTTGCQGACVLSN